MINLTDLSEDQNQRSNHAPRLRSSRSDQHPPPQIMTGYELHQSKYPRQPHRKDIYHCRWQLKDYDPDLLNALKFLLPQFQLKKANTRLIRGPV